jgi:hypothetical protein
MGLLATSRTNAGLVTKVPSIQSDQPQNVRTLNCRRVSTPLSRRLSGARRTDRDSDDCQIARGPLMILNEINGLPGSAHGAAAGNPPVFRACDAGFAAGTICE